MPDLKKFKISFLRDGHIDFINVFSSNLHDSEVWKHLADRIGIIHTDSEGHTILSHALKKIVEANGVTDVTLEVFAVTSIMGPS